MIDEYLRVRKLTKGLWKRCLLAKSKGSEGDSALFHEIQVRREKPSPSLPSRRTISEVLR